MPNSFFSLRTYCALWARCAVLIFGVHFLPRGKKRTKKARQGLRPWIPRRRGRRNRSRLRWETPFPKAALKGEGKCKLSVLFGTASKTGWAGDFCLTWGEHTPRISKKGEYGPLFVFWELFARQLLLFTHILRPLGALCCWVFGVFILCHTAKNEPRKRAKGRSPLDPRFRLRAFATLRFARACGLLDTQTPPSWAQYRAPKMVQRRTVYLLFVVDVQRGAWALASWCLFRGWRVFAFCI